MNRIGVAAAALLALIVAWVVVWRCGPASVPRTSPAVSTAAAIQQPGSAASSPAPVPMGVTAFMAATDVPRTTVTIHGIISSVLPERHLITLIDAADAACAADACCAPATLPVAWDRPAPAQGSVVRVLGRVAEADGKLVFAAEQIEAWPPAGR
jgi:hypothetical protein